MQLKNELGFLESNASKLFFPIYQNFFTCYIRHINFSELWIQVVISN